MYAFAGYCHCQRVFRKKSTIWTWVRGSTPGHYVLRYMARDDAVERLSFSKKRELDSEDELYRARERASEYQDSMDGLRTSFRRFGPVLALRSEMAVYRSRINGCVNCLNVFSPVSMQEKQCLKRFCRFHKTI